MLRRSLAGSDEAIERLLHRCALQPRFRQRTLGPTKVEVENHVAFRYAQARRAWLWLMSHSR